MAQERTLLSDAYIEMDYGKDVEIDRIAILNRGSCCQSRITYTTLTVRTAAGTVDWSCRITRGVNGWYNFPVRVDTHAKTDADIMVVQW